MKNRKQTSPDAVVDVMTVCRRRCCLCFGLRADTNEKKGQIAHLDRDPSNNEVDNLAFLCLDHHDQYDSRTSQSKGLTIDEVKRYRTELLAFVARTIPPSDADIVAALAASLDRPAFRTPFRGESSLPRFCDAITETIQTLNTGLTPQGIQLPSKFQVRDPVLRSDIDKVVEALVALRAKFDAFIRTGAIKHCGCGQDDCPVFMFSEEAAKEMDRRRRTLLGTAHKLSPAIPNDFYDLR
ncbi:MAG: hypothetical protein C0390_07695 [Syntrophus sp. (in: bacteria)]|nr:hypothetical protein [Syntrophus sp. (in: bacteria)]